MEGNSCSSRRSGKCGDENTFKGFSRAKERRGQPQEMANGREARVQIEGAVSKAAGRTCRPIELATAASLNLQARVMMQVCRIPILKARLLGPGSNLQRRMYITTLLGSFSRPSPQAACKPAWRDQRKAPRFSSILRQTFRKLSLRNRSEAP